MADAEAKETILLPDDLRRNLEDRRRTLMQGLYQPIGLLITLAQVFLVALAARRAGDLCVVAIVDENTRQRVAVQLDCPAAGLRPQQHIGNDRLGGGAVESEAGPWIERLELRQSPASLSTAPTPSRSFPMCCCGRSPAEIGR